MAFSYHTENHIFGRGENPWNRGRSVGGSSGGCAGLVAANCTPFSIGADVGGSLRVPASFCGVTSFVPTPKRVSLYGNLVYTGNHHHTVEPAHILIGPMTWNVDDAKLLFKLSCETQRLNPALVKVPFNEELYEETLNKTHKFGMLMGVDWIHGLCPTVIRAQKEVA